MPGCSASESMSNASPLSPSGDPCRLEGGNPQKHTKVEHVNIILKLTFPIYLGDVLQQEYSFWVEPFREGARLNK